MRIPSDRWKAFEGFELRRTPEGVMEVRAKDDGGLAHGLGFAHAHDRLVAMALLRLIGQGRLSECLQANAETLGVDTFMREMGFRRNAAAELQGISEPTRAVLERYCAGVNTFLREHRRPAALLAVRYRPEPWTVEDCILIVKIMGYVGLAQTQGDLERFIVQAVAAGVNIPRLKALFHPHLDALDDELAELMRQVRLYRPLVPPEVRFSAAIPKLVASNNWAVAGRRTATGGALQCNDPHLEINRLPPIWYEFVGHLPEDYRAGISLPGVPGLVMGRTKDVSGGFTYGFMDQIDFFIEEVRDGKVRRGDTWVAPTLHQELILRKGDEALMLEVRETDRGTIEADSTRPLEDGYYLSRAWSGSKQGAAASFDAMLARLDAHDVEAAMKAVRPMAISCNWLFADRHGRIGYQQTGIMPKRKRGTGMLALPAWDEGTAWEGFVDPDELVHEVDPESGVLVTANEDRNRPGFPEAINLPMASYRADRILELLGSREDLDIPRMREIQSDLYSLQAQRLLEILNPLLPNTPEAALLRRWDRRYDVDSRGAVVFEHVYAALLEELFGRGLFGEPLWEYLTTETSVVPDYFGRFDEILLGNDPLWYGESKDALLRRVVDHALSSAPGGRYGDGRAVMLTNVLFAGKLPGFLGVDHGPIELPGSRATVVQGNLFRAHGRLTSFAPSWRYITDLAHDAMHTAIPGGVSGRRTSRLYLSDLERYLAFDYKETAIKD